MFDSMSNYQHHDGVTGTAQQHVADDYSLLLANSMAQSNAVFEKYVGEDAARFAGLESADWGMCSQMNSTYTACPVHAGHNEFAVTSYNPSSVPVELQTFKVPPQDNGYEVEVFD